MAKIKNVSGEDRTVPWLGGRLVVADAVVEVPADQVTAYTQQEGTWAPHDAEATRIHEEMLDGIAALRAGEEAADADPGEVVEEHTADELIKSVIPGSDATTLDELRAAEEQRPKPRSTVLAAIDARVAELDAGDAGEDSHNDNEES